MRVILCGERPCVFSACVGKAPKVGTVKAKRVGRCGIHGHAVTQKGPPSSCPAGPRGSPCLASSQIRRRNASDISVQSSDVSQSCGAVLGRGAASCRFFLRPSFLEWGVFYQGIFY